MTFELLRFPKEHHHHPFLHLNTSSISLVKRKEHQSFKRLARGNCNNIGQCRSAGRVFRAF
jgi:hypothetical protein